MASVVQGRRLNLRSRLITSDTSPKSKRAKTGHSFAAQKEAFFSCEYCSRLYQSLQLLEKHLVTCESKLYILAIDEEIRKTNPDATTTENGLDLIQTLSNIEQVQRTRINFRHNVRVEEKRKNDEYSFEEEEEKPKPTLSDLNLKTCAKKEEIPTHKLSDECIIIPENPENIVLPKLTRAEARIIRFEEKKMEKELEIKERLRIIAKRLKNTTCDNNNSPVQENPDETPTGIYTCKKCNQNFDTSLELLRHSRESHSYPKIFMNQAEIEKFMHQEDRSTCPICEKKLNTTFKSFYVKHLQTHSANRDFKCPVCNKKFTRHDHMQHHVKRH